MSSVALNLLPSHGPGSQVAWWQGQPVNRETFLHHVNQARELLPQGRFAVNLCEDRYLFMVTFAAVIAQTQTNLLPPNRAREEIRRLLADYPNSYTLQDHNIKPYLTCSSHAQKVSMPAIAPNHVAAVVFTSGSTGRPCPHGKRWGELVATTRIAQRRFGFYADAGITVVATVPPQHMYGLETSVLTPLITGVSVHGGRPFFPEDIRGTLAAVPAPRVLITTPAHLRVCIESGLSWPQLAFIISATAPLSNALAARVEKVFQTQLLEIYGFTEAGSVASRRTLDGDLWHLYNTMRIDTQNHCLVAPHLSEPAPLNDIIESHGKTHFKLLGRRADVINIAGKRASLADLNARLNDIEGIVDGAFVLPTEQEEKISRLIAFVVAPRISEREIMTALTQRIDPAFLPRPLYKVARLPRNETGKLPQWALRNLLNKIKTSRTNADIAQR
jgi:acyl-coenzyme A synthetase/AMP-(fatty) acid ligase